MGMEILTIIAVHVLPPLAAGMIWYWLVMPFLGRWEPYIYVNVLIVLVLVAGLNYLRNYTTYADWTVAEYYALANKTQSLIFVLLLIAAVISYVRLPKLESLPKR